MPWLLGQWSKRHNFFLCCCPVQVAKASSATVNCVFVANFHIYTSKKLLQKHNRQWWCLNLHWLFWESSNKYNCFALLLLCPRRQGRFSQHHWWLFFQQSFATANAKGCHKSTIDRYSRCNCLGSLGSAATNVIILLCSCPAQGAKASSANVTVNCVFVATFWLYDAKDCCRNTIDNDNNLICLGSLGRAATNMIILLCSCLAQEAKVSSANVTVNFKRWLQKHNCQWRWLNLPWLLGQYSNRCNYFAL